MDQIHEEYKLAFLKLKQAYVNRLKNTIRIIDNIFDLKKYKSLTREDLLRVQVLVHGLAGSGTTFGYPQVTEIGRKADHFIHNLLIEGHHINGQNLALLISMLKTIQDTCRNICNEAQHELPESANTNKPKSENTQGQAHVLIIDDDRDVAAAIAYGLESFGATSQIAGSGEDALHYLARTQPHMIILDIELKGIDGFEVLQQIKQNSEFIDIPVVILSTRHNQQDEEWALRAGALTYVHKPIDILSFSQRIMTLIKDDQSQAQSM